MKIVAFVHSLASCWNNGNAHFQRGVLRELARAGHDVCVYEAADAWSRSNLVQDHGSVAASGFAAAYPEISLRVHGGDPDLAQAVDDADIVLVHEWNSPALVAALGRERRHGHFTLLFHDTHHRAISDPEAMARYDLSEYDGVLAFGAALAQVYERRGWGRRAMVWHEAADHRLFHPGAQAAPAYAPVVWVGNWGEGERSAELAEFLFDPCSAAGVPLDIYGVRYPDEALAALKARGVMYHGWLGNIAAPAVLRQALATVHVPRRFYAEQLPGIPTIRVFEALATGTPLLCAPWQDSEGLFSVGEDFLMARSGREMTALLCLLRADAALRAQLAKRGRATILARHTCAHRARELLHLVARLRGHDTLGLEANNDLPMTLDAPAHALARQPGRVAASLRQGT